MLPGEIPIVNRSGDTIPANSLARIVGRDGTDDTFWEVGKPDADDQPNIVTVPEALADDRKGIGLLPTHPRIVTQSEGVSLAAGDWLGASSGSWSAASGTTLYVVDADSTLATVMLAPAEAATASACWLNPLCSRWNLSSSCTIYLYCRTLTDAMPLVEMPAGTVTAARLAIAGNIKDGTCTFSLESGSRADWDADGDIDSWSAAGDLDTLGVGNQGALVTGLSLTVADGDCLRVAVTSDGDWDWYGSDIACWLEFQPA